MSTTKKALNKIKLAALEVKKQLIKAKIKLIDKAQKFEDRHLEEPKKKRTDW